MEKQRLRRQKTLPQMKFLPITQRNYKDFLKFTSYNGNKKLKSTLTVPEVARTDGEEECALMDCAEACGKTSMLTRVSRAGGGRLLRDLDLFPA